MIYIRNYLSILFLFLLSIQVVLIAYQVAGILPVGRPQYFYFESVALYFNENKRLELVTYLLGVCFLGVFFLSALTVSNYTGKQRQQRLERVVFALLKAKSKSFFFLILFLYFLAPYIIYKTALLTWWGLPLQILVFLSGICGYFGSCLLRFKRQAFMLDVKIEKFIELIQSNQKKIYTLILFAAFSQLIYLFYDPIINKPKLINEYWNIPETTLFSSGEQIENKFFYQNFKNINQNPDRASLSMSQAVDERTEEWLKLNQYELAWQVMSRHMIHHHGFMTVPMQELQLDKDVRTISAQYGLGSAWVFQKLFSLFDGVSLHGWMKLSYLFYYVYFFIFIIVTYLITRNLGWTVAIFLFSLSLVNYRGYDFLLLPPGESPWRHFFDIVIVYFLYQYVEKKNFSYYLLALTLGIVSVIINPQIGLMIFLATITAGLFYAYYEKQQVKRILASSISALVIALICFKFSSSANDLAKYYLDGVIGFPITFAQMLKLFIIITIGYILFWKILKERLALNYIHIVFLMIYSQELILYIVWHYNGDGFKSRAFIYILTMAFLIFPFRKIVVERWKNYLMLGLATVVAIVYIGSVSKVYKSKREYEKIFDHHVTYQWNMDRAHIISTMNPVYFQNGIDLIQKYSKGQNGIYIISEYDNLLPFLANKYSLMPFFDLKWYSITPKELNKAIQTLKINKPEFLFVDSDIHRNLDNEILNQYIPVIGSYYQESVWRAERLKLLYSIYKNIDEEYKLVETSSLISVYKRIGSH